MKSQLTTALAVLAALAVPARAQDTDVLCFDDLEDGVPDHWALPDEGWQLVPDGTCGLARTWMFATSDPSTCATAPGSHSSTLWTSFDITLNSEPFLVEFDYQLELDADDLAEVQVLDPSLVWSARFPLSTTTGPTHFQALVQPPQESFILAGGVRLEFHFEAGPHSNSGFGWLIDNVRVTYPIWKDLGSAKPGSSGTPELKGGGLLFSGTANALELRNAAPFSAATLVFGF